MNDQMIDELSRLQTFDISFSRRRNSIFKSISKSCDGNEGDDVRAGSPFIDVEALSDDDDEIASASESSNDSAPKSTVEAEPVKTDFKEEVEVIETVERLILESNKVSPYLNII